MALTRPWAGNKAYIQNSKKNKAGNIPRHYPVNGGCCIFRLDDGHEETSEREKSEMLVERHDQSSLPPANSSGESDDGGDMEVIQVEEKGRGWGRREQWDCESLLRQVDVFGVCRQNTGTKHTVLT